MRWKQAHNWAMENRVRYIERLWRLAEMHGKMLEPRHVLAFVLFTPMNRYERTVKEWKQWMNTGRVPHGNLWRTRELWINRMPKNETLLVGPTETWNDYIEDLVSRVAGLRWSKAPFFASLMYPTYINVPICVDIHMSRWLGRKESPIVSKKQYQQSQSVMQNRAGRAGMPAFAYQWAVWDYERSGGTPVTETNIANDLKV